MKKILCIVLAFCLALSATPVALALNDDTINDSMKEIYEANGLLSYYEHCGDYTINAVLHDGTIEYLFADHKSNQVYRSISSVDAETQALLSEISTWESICKAEASSAQLIYEDDMSASGDIGFVPPAISDLQDTRADLVNLLKDEFGSQFHSNRYLDTVVRNGINVYIFDSFEYDIEYQGQKTNSASLTLQAFATLLGCKWTALGIFLGLAFGELVPANTSISYYVCMVDDARQGRINGTAYYAIAHQMAYPAFDDVNIANDVTILFDEPLYDFYTDSQSIFESLEAIADETIAVYQS